jgi:hypothetical protein
MKEVLKAIAWGITTLMLVFLLLFSAAALYFVTSENCWLTSSKIDAIYAKVLPIVKTLSNQYPGEESKKSLLGVEYHREADAANSEIDQVTRTICPGVSYYRSETLFELYSPKDKLGVIAQYQKEPSRIGEYNTYSVVRFVCMLAILVFSIYTTYRLAKFRRFNFHSNLFFLLMATPVVAVISSLGLIYSDLSLSTHNADGAVKFIALSIVWIFVVYPVLFVSAKKHNGLKKCIFPFTDKQRTINSESNL